MFNFYWSIGCATVIAFTPMVYAVIYKVYAKLFDVRTSEQICNTSSLFFLTCLLNLVVWVFVLIAPFYNWYR